MPGYSAVPRTRHFEMSRHFPSTPMPTGARATVHREACRSMWMPESPSRLHRTEEMRSSYLVGTWIPGAVKKLPAHQETPKFRLRSSHGF
ncbi:hypothetical protein ACRE_068360 [Hapsidospora chrysogenum ATCC 11550]|uniref:Uncharacterized protein n=1 Tax=Hapsidospora chrysogenum (strain ATCC 11550 / CBS 779.69 / DSM 880 / IAM 14645 / JCM 23072 / IMI 49137) TaxID=857340 RepID=A0A086SZB6_HAPC1|nr:hypothetical protein ACRE_068360 [Hapsidospora chrysogenum ATCC 11550]